MVEAEKNGAKSGDFSEMEGDQEEGAPKFKVVKIDDKLENSKEYD